MNDQPWDFVVLTARKICARFTDAGHGEFIANAAFAVLVLARETDCALEDCSAATENLLIAAASHALVPAGWPVPGSLMLRSWPKLSGA